MNFYSFWLFLFYCDLIIGPLFAFFGQMGYSAYGGFKIIYIAVFLLTVLYAFVKDKLLISKVSLLFIVFSLISIFIGLIRNSINAASFPHLFAIIMPIFAIPFGNSISKNYINTEQFDNKFNKLMNSVFWINSLTIILYRVAFLTGIVPYPAIGAMGLYFTALYYLVNNKKALYVLSIIGIVISGKRVVLVIVLLSTLYHFYKEGKINLKSNFKNIIFLSISVLGLYYLYNYTPYLNRFALTINNLDFKDEYSMYLATGGRSSEIIKIIKYLNEKPWMWIVGSGLGFKVEVFDGFYRHYSHFTPLGYIMLFGSIFTFILYLFLFKATFIKINRDDNRYLFKLYYIGLLISSFFGGILFNDVKFWIILGIVYKLDKDQINK